MENYIKSLYAKQIGVFDSLQVHFNPRFNLIVGPNGCGKTSILKTLALPLNPGDAGKLRYGESSSVWFDAAYDGSIYRVGLGEGWVKNGSEYRTAMHRVWASPPSIDGRPSLSVNGIENNEINITPLFLGAYRRIEYKRIDGLKREAEVSAQRVNYHKSSLEYISGGSLPDVKQWMINRYFEMDKDWAQAYKDNWDWLISNLHILAPLNTDLHFKSIRRDLEPVFTLNGVDCYLEEISAGFQAVLSLIFSIVEWIEGTNLDDYASMRKATGTVVIDELDAHLHPEWQLTLRESLLRLFPKLQFIVTTHSPHLIASVQSGELMILPSLEKDLSLHPANKTYSGWSTDEILADVMGVRSLENKTYMTLLNEALDSYENGDILGLKSSIDKISQVVHPSNTILSVLRIQLAQLYLKDKGI